MNMAPVSIRILMMPLKKASHRNVPLKRAKAWRSSEAGDAISGGMGVSNFAPSAVETIAIGRRLYRPTIHDRLMARRPPPLASEAARPSDQEGSGSGEECSAGGCGTGRNSLGGAVQS